MRTIAMWFASGTGKTSAEAQMVGSFTAAEWDLDATWTIGRVRTGFTFVIAAGDKIGGLGKAVFC